MLSLGEYLLTCAAEECVETAQRISKAIRFGLDEVQSGQSLTNRQRIIAEYNDLIAVMRLLDLHVEDPVMQLAKVEKIARYQRYAADRGTLMHQGHQCPECQSRDTYTDDMGPLWRCNVCSKDFNPGVLR